MKFLKKNDNWVTPTDTNEGVDPDGEWSYGNPFTAESNS